jgi:hypothetical protein
MKRKIALVAACLLVFAQTMLAATVQTLTINGETLDNTVAKITFEGDNVVLLFSDATTMTVGMEDVLLAFDYSELTAIQSLKGLVGETLQLNGLEPGTTVAIYDASGKQVMTAKAEDTSSLLSAKTLKPGVYLLKTDKHIVKFVKK